MAKINVSKQLKAARKKAQGRAGAGGDKTVQITARIPRKEWLKMCDIRSHDGLSHQDQIVYGLALLFERAAACCGQRAMVAVARA